MAITLDFTGLFYEKQFDITELGPSPSVQSLTSLAVGKVGDTGGKLIFAEFNSGGFLSSAYVEHNSNPATRQKDIAGNPAPRAALPIGIYGFNDSLNNNRIKGVEISFTLSWQYYIFRDGKLISGASANSTDRVIVPATQSASATPLEANDIVRWRLVAIGGLQELIDQKMSEMTPSTRGRLMSRILTERLTVKEIAKAAANNGLLE
jgi:hypothetical protein